LKPAEQDMQKRKQGSERCQNFGWVRFTERVPEHNNKNQINVK